MNREEAILIIKELLEKCRGLDGHYFELSPPYSSTPSAGGYQIIIHATLAKETKNQIKPILTKHQLSHQEGTMWKIKR